MSEKEKDDKTELTIVKDGKEEKKNMNKPSPEEVKQFKEEFDKAVEEFNNFKWKISENGQFAANDVGMFLQDFMQNWALWTKTGWMGMIKMDEEIKTALTKADENTGLELGYQALEFCAYMLSNPGKIGLESAYEFEKIADKYSKIGIVVGEKVEEARERLKKIDYMQQKWAAGEQGFYMEELTKEHEEKKAAEEEEKQKSDIPPKK